MHSRSNLGSYVEEASPALGLDRKKCRTEKVTEGRVQQSLGLSLSPGTTAPLRHY